MKKDETTEFGVAELVKRIIPKYIEGNNILCEW